VLSLEHGFWKWSSHQKSEATEICILLLQPQSSSFLKIRSILMEIWSDMWWRNWVGIQTTTLLSLEHGFWKWRSNRKSEATESCVLLLQPQIYLVFENQINIDGDMVRYVVTKLSWDLDYCISSVRSAPKAPTGGSNTAWTVQ
jgi:hypothetical protein